MTPAPDPESLLEHDSFVRALARAILTDENAVDDVVQQTWLGALRAEAPPRALHSWLATLVRNAARDALRRGETRARRERQGGREEAVPSMQTIFEREESRREVVAALAALPELYRDAIVLRYFEDLTPRVMAHRLEVPAETARTRVKRGLELLRAELARRRGGAGPAALSLLPLAGWHLSFPSSTLFGAAAMTVNTKVAVGLTALVLAALGLWWSMGRTPWSDVNPQDPGRTIAEAPAAAANGLTTPAAAASTPSSEPKREAAASSPDTASAPATPFGSLLVRVVWHDNTPAAGVGIAWFPWAQANGRVFAKSLTTDAEGCLRIDKAPVGIVYVLLDRAYGGSAEIAPAKESELRVQVRQGTDVRGKVVNGRGEPIDGAEIRLWEDPQGDQYVATRSDVKGEFLVRQVDCNRFWVFVTKPGFAPSDAKQPNVTIGGTENLTFELSKAAFELRGRVRDVKGTPIEGALVIPSNGADRLTAVARVKGIPTSAAPVPGTETNVKGEFVVSCLAQGKIPLVVRAPGFAMWKEEVHVNASQPEPLDIVVREQIVLEGTVKDEAGSPVKRASVTVGNLGAPDYFSAVPSALDGSFRIEGLPMGPFTVHVRTIAIGATSATLQGEQGQVLRWDAVLKEVGVLRGRVVDERGNPCVGFYVKAFRKVNDLKSPLRGGESRTDPNGDFKIVSCPPDPMMVHVTLPSGGFNVKQLNDVRLSNGTLTIVVPNDLDVTAVVKGSVKDTQGNPLPSARVRVEIVGAGGGYGDFAVKPDGTFESPKHLAGSYRVRVNVPDFGSWTSPVKRVNTGETWDLGTIQIPKAGALVIVLHPDKALTNDKYQIVLSAEEQMNFESLRFEIPGTISAPQPFSPGHYSLYFQSMSVNPGTSVNRIEFDIRSGEETRVDVDLRAAAHRLLTFTLPKDTPPGEAEKETLQVTVKGEAGDVVRESKAIYSADQALFYSHWVYTPGKYRFEALTTRGLKASGEFTVGAPSSKVETITTVLSR